MYLISLTISLAVAASLAASIWQRGEVGPQLARRVGVIGIPIALLTCIGAIVLQMIGTTVALAVARRRKWTRGPSLAALMAACLLPYVAWTTVAIPELMRLDELRQQFPLTSLSNRLPNFVPIESPETVSDRLPELISARLERQENHWKEKSIYVGRGDVLHRLHERWRDWFIVAPGFGYLRMGPGSFGPNTEFLEGPQAASIALPIITQVKASPEPEHPESAEPKFQQPTRPGLIELHDSGTADFLDPERMGYAEDINHTIGFKPHAMSKVPAAESDERPTEPWTLHRLELVSLLLHDEPVVYVSDSLPRMDNLRDVETRPLNAFESGALERLWTEQDLVIENVTDAEPSQTEGEPSNRVRMLGSLRAIEQCQACHKVPRGTLLGAFSYELSPPGESED
ncbi:hypothetical protein [Stratiformator vulcanicus]|nr:hypothetical protein [Stratiformator vulcanicus]